MKRPFWQCRGCVEDGGIAYPVAVASVMSQFPRRPNPKSGRFSKHHRPYFDVMGERIPIEGKKQVYAGGARVRCTMAGRRALYQRRQEVQAFGIQRGMGPYQCGILPDCQLHDEYLWLYRTRLRFTGLQRPFYSIEANRRAFRGLAQERDDALIAEMRRRCPPSPPSEAAPAPELVAPSVRYGSSLEDWDEDDVCPTPVRPAKRVRLVSKTPVSATAVDS